MLSKAEIKACLAGEPTPIVPARFFWFDGKFIEPHREEVDRMQARWEDDFVHVWSKLTKRAAEGDLEDGEFTDDWGCRFKASPDGVGAHPTRPIVTGLDEWHKYVAESMPTIPAETFKADVAKGAADHADAYVIAEFWRTFYERMYMVIGFEQLMMEIADGGELFLTMLDDLKSFTRRGVELIGQAGADGVFLADDWGTQHRLQISPAMWRKYFKPAYGELIDVAHSLGMDCWLHSCGNIMEIVGDWVDIGLEVLTHLQPAALDLPAIARKYRGQMTFFGGIDVQYNIVHGTRETIRDEVRSLIEMFDAFNGKYMLSPANSVMPETPVENAWHMCEAFDEFRRE